MRATLWLLMAAAGCGKDLDSGYAQEDADADGWGELGGDCDDGNSDVYPGATEECDDVDNDCDGIVDEDPRTARSGTPTPTATASA